MVIIILVNMAVTFNVNKSIRENIDLAKEKARPAKIEMLIIANSKCTDCFDITPVVSYVKSANVNVTSEKTLQRELEKVKNDYSLTDDKAFIFWFATQILEIQD